MEARFENTQAVKSVRPANAATNSVARQAAKFIALAFGISWAVWIIAIRLGAHPGKGEEILAFGSAGPALAAIFLSRSGRKERRMGTAARLLWFAMLWAACWTIYILSDEIRGVNQHPSLSFCVTVAALAAIPAWIGSGAISSDAGVWTLLRTLAVPKNWRWQAVALFSLPAILLIPTAILRALGKPIAIPRTGVSIEASIAYGALMFFRALFFTAYFEEPGWRGFLVSRLQQKFSPLLTSLLVWLPWALWHAPLDYNGPLGHNLVGYVQTRGFGLLLTSIILTWFYNRSGGNLLCVAIFHAGMNTFPFVLPYSPVSLGLVLVWATYIIVADKMWRRSAVPSG